MIYNSVAEIYESLDKTRNDLKQRVSELSEEQKIYRAEQNGWSVTEIVEHLVTVESGVVKLAAKLLAKAESAGVKSDGTLKPPVTFVERAQSIENRKLQAPERIHPQGSLSIDESLAKLDENRKALNEMRPRVEAANATDTAFPHPFFGNLNLYEWLAMIGVHEERHLQQIENILAKKGL